jgi:hypothetical protein
MNVSIPLVGGCSAQLSAASGGGRWPGVVVIHDAAGMTRDLLRLHPRLGAAAGRPGCGPRRAYWTGRLHRPDRRHRLLHGGGFALMLAADHGFSVASVN